MGLLLVLVVLGGMAALVLAATSVAPPDLDLSTSEPLVPAAPGRAAAAGGGAASANAAAVAACEADVATVEAAMATARAVRGSVPTTLGDLVSQGFLAEVPTRPGFAFAPEVVNGSATGRVTVNGRPGREGCAAPPP